MCNQQSLRSAWAYAQSDQSLCLSLEYPMSVKLLTEHHFEFLSLKRGCRGSSESTHVKMPHCWKSHAMAQFSLIMPLKTLEKILLFALIYVTYMLSLYQHFLNYKCCIAACRFSYEPVQYFHQTKSRAANIFNLKLFIPAQLLYVLLQ